MNTDQTKGLRRLCRWIAGSALLVITLLMTAAHANATTLTDYRDRVARAAAAIERLSPSYTEEDLSSREQRITTTIGQVRDSLPAKETITVAGERIEVDNEWLRADLSDFEKMNHADQKTAQAADRIAERLRALEVRLNEVESANSSGATKDETKGRMAEILRRPEFNQQVEESNALQRLWNRIVKVLIEILNWFLRLLNRLFPGLKELQPGSAKTVSSIAQFLVVGIALAVIAFIAWKLVPRYLRNRPKKKARKREARVVLGETLAPDQTAADLFAEAESLAHSGDLRAAIRKAYIALLCELGDRKLISLAQHKTNRDYLNAVRDKSRLYGSMRPLTISFENHWYGLIPAGENDWHNFRDGYQQALRVN